jgi:hypothetical protein
MSTPDIVLWLIVGSLVVALLWGRRAGKRAYQGSIAAAESRGEARAGAAASSHVSVQVSDIGNHRVREHATDDGAGADDDDERSVRRRDVDYHFEHEHVTAMDRARAEHLGRLRHDRRAPDRVLDRLGLQSDPVTRDPIVITDAVAELVERKRLDPGRVE